MLNISHQVLPITIDNSQLFAELEDGEVIAGETNIDIPKHNSSLKIKKVFLKPEAKIYPKAFDSIKNADLIVVGPGDLYSSLAQILLVEGTAQAIKESKAKKVYICNLMNLSGIHPKEVFRWFMEMYVDSSDWVMAPNVMGMGLFSDGGIFATKPYICGSAYILKSFMAM